jgi:hypothetical protein
MQRILAVGAALGLVASAVGAPMVILNEPFDYASHAALAAVWTASSDNPDYQLDLAFGNPLPSYAMPSPSANFQGRLARNLGGDFNGTDAEPLVMSYDLYLADAGETALWDGARHYLDLGGWSGDVWGSGSLENLLEVGVRNADDEGSDNATLNMFYQGRVTFGSNWNTLNDEAGAPGRAVGWHNLKTMVTTSEVRFFVDGVLAEVEARPNGFGFDSVRLGSDLTANGWDAWADNLVVEIVPEPASLSLLLLGGLALLRRR